MLSNASDNADLEGVLPTTLTRRSGERVEDAALLSGRQRFIDDLGVAAGTLHAAFVRSPHAHAELVGIDDNSALACAGVHIVVTGADIERMAKPFTVGVKAPMRHWALAVDRVRYQGEPVAIVLADSAYAAEDGAAAVTMSYRPLPAVVDPCAATQSSAPQLHPEVGSNVVSERHFRYGEPEIAFSEAEHVVEIACEYPRNSVTPIECFGVIAEHHQGDDSFEVTSNFQGPFALHPVMALALQVPANRLRLKSPPASGGSFGTKQGVFPYIVALCIASKIAGRPVKWIEDRLEHLMSASSATNRVTTLKAAVNADGRITALDWDQLDDCGAYLKAPEPATLYRMHGNMTGAYDVSNVIIRNRNVLTNKCPTGLVRGFGGPQVYFALERLVQRIAKVLDRDPLDVITANLIASDAFPYRTASGGLYDSGNYQAAIRLLTEGKHVAELEQRRSDARKDGRFYGIGYAAIVEPSISNMGYITTALTHEQRERAGPKGGAISTATVAVDGLGGVSVHVASVPQGQGHKTVLAQVVADALGLSDKDITVNTDLDTGRDAWSVASGNYSSRFAGAVAGTAHLAAVRLKHRLAELAATQLDCNVDEVRFSAGSVYRITEPESGIPFRRVAATSHWAQSTLPQGMEPVLRETAFWSPDVLSPPNAADEINSSAVHGFVLDACGVEIDPVTGQIRIDKYVTVHDAGRLLHPAMADGQVRGGFANALGAAVFEQFSYGSDGSFQSGTFADYTVPTASETPDIEILHLETLSPVTPLGAKGIGEGNCMSTPVCIANAVSDALGIDDLSLPLTPSRVHALLRESEPPAPNVSSIPQPTESYSPEFSEYALTGNGSATVSVARQKIWDSLLNPNAMRQVIPGCQRLDQVSADHFTGTVELGVGIVKGLFNIDVHLSEMDEPNTLRLSGEAKGPLGASRGEGRVVLIEEKGHTRVAYVYGLDVSGKIAAIGGRMIKGAAKMLIAEFFRRLANQADPHTAGSDLPDKASLLTGLLRLMQPLLDLFRGRQR